MDVAAVVAAGLPGLAVSAPGGEAAAGIANLETGEPLTLQHRFRIGSVSKTFIAAVVLQLVDEGAFTLDGEADPVVPGISVRQLLDHTSGLPNPDVLQDMDTLFEPYRRDPKHRWEMSQRELLESALEQPRLFPPGEGWSYSGTNYLALGLLLEETTGTRIREELTTRVIEPLGLESTDLPDDITETKGLARGYLSPDNPVLPGPEPVDVTELDLPFNWAGGGVVSTPGDVARFLGALLGGDLLPAGLRAEMLRTVPSDWPETDEYGLGIGRIASLMRTVASPCGPAWGHLGFSAGYITVALASEDGARQVACTSNWHVMTEEFWKPLGELVWSAYCG